MGNAGSLLKEALYGEWTDIGSEMKEFKDFYEELWWKSGTSLPELSDTIDRRSKVQKEKKLDSFIKYAVEFLKHFPEDGEERRVSLEKLKTEARDTGRFSLGLKDSYMDTLSFKGFSQVTNEFVKDARNFDSGMDIEEIFQAIRNVWIMNSIQIMLDAEMEYTPSLFAYSMLYPYSDNYLDDPYITRQMKADINGRFGKRLAGERLIPQNCYESSLFKLVGMIEGQYPRRDYPGVYESLLAIHEAQEKSLQQQGVKTSPYRTDILGISFAKGGASVLADAFLVKGELSREEAQFMFGFGVFLQLADDLQDVGCDLRNSHMTIFSQIAGIWKLDDAACKLINFMYSVIDNDRRFTSQKSVDIKEVMKYNCTFLILQAVAKNKRFFSREFLRLAEQYSPFRFKYMSKLYDNVKKEYNRFNRNNKGMSAEDIFNAAVLQSK